MFSVYHSDVIELLKILSCVPFLFYACYSDIKTRTVDNKVWLWMLYLLSIFLIYDMSKLNFDVVLYSIVSIIITFIIVEPIRYFGGFGGADAKALLVLSAMFYEYPILRYPFYTPLFDLPNIRLFTFIILVNAVWFTIPFLIYIYIKKDKRPIPFMIPITCGFISAVVFGDLTYSMIGSVLTWI